MNDVELIKTRICKLLANAAKAGAGVVHINAEGSEGTIKFDEVAQESVPTDEVSKICRVVYCVLTDEAEAVFDPLSKQYGRIMNSLHLPDGVTEVRVSTAPGATGYSMWLSLVRV